MTDKTPPIIDIQGVVFWDEVVNPQTMQPELRPVRTEIRFQREGFDEWEILRYQNVVPDRLQNISEATGKNPE
jgi:hypothetical protein